MTVTTGRDRHCTCRAQLPGLSGRRGPAGTLRDSWGSRRLPGDRGLEEPSEGVSEEDQGQRLCEADVKTG